MKPIDLTEETQTRTCHWCRHGTYRGWYCANTENNTYCNQLVDEKCTVVDWSKCKCNPDSKE